MTRMICRIICFGEQMKIRSDLVACYVARPDVSGTLHEFLQLLRASDDYMGGTWQAIAGCMEKGETVWQAALRELKEEAGLTPLEFYRIGTVNSFYIPAHDGQDDTLWHQIPFLAIISRDSEIVLNDEHEAFRWIARNDADGNFMWPSDRENLILACRDILDSGLAKDFLRIMMV